LSLISTERSSKDWWSAVGSQRVVKKEYGQSLKSCWVKVVNRREEVEMEVVKVVSQSVVLRVKQSGRRDSRRSARRVVGSVEGY